MRILLTGSNGFIGRHVLARLMAAGHEVFALNRGHVDPGAGAGVHFLDIDLLSPGLDLEPVRALRADCLVHLAWYTCPGDYWHSMENISWLAATTRLVEAFANAGGKRVVAAGSCAEYDWHCGVCREDETALRPGTLYGAAKNATFQLLQRICDRNSVELLWGRVFFLYGSGEAAQRLIPSILNAMIHNQPVRCTHGRQRRDFLHVDDVASAFVHLAVSGCAPGAYNVSSGSAISVRDIVALCQRLSGSGSEVHFGAIAAAADDPAEILGPNGKLASTGWAPSRQLESGLLEYLETLRGALP